jgi:hypothetical protein
MHAKRKDVERLNQEEAWGDMDVAWETLDTGLDSTPLFKGLPDDACQCPHWGIVLKGRLRVMYAGHDEVISAGEVFYLPPGHNAVVEEECEMIQFSLKGEYKKTMEVVARTRAELEKDG